MKILKVILPICLLFLLYKFSYISFEPIKSLFLFGDLKLILLILILSFSLSFLLYIRFNYCLKIYKIQVNCLKQIEVSSQAFSFASFIPGQIGIDAWRIANLRKLDLTKFKTNLIKSTILEIDGSNAEVDIGGIQLQLPRRELIPGDAMAAIRPQSICLHESGAENGIPGTILKSSYLGDHLEYTVKCELGELFVIDNQMHNQHPSGAKVSITFRSYGVSLIPES